MPGHQYTTGLLIGRAFAHANRSASNASEDVAEELCQLADGDRTALVLARARFQEFLAGPTPSPADERALRLLEAALRRFDRLCAA